MFTPATSSFAILPLTANQCTSVSHRTTTAAETPFPREDSSFAHADPQDPAEYGNNRVARNRPHSGESWQN